MRSNVPIPQPGPNQVLVEILFAGQNPPDAFVLDPVRSAAYHHPDNVMGSDFAGVVVQSSSTTVPVGSSVCGWVPGNASTSGTFAQYVACDSNLVVRCPANIPMEQMAALTFSFFTALHGLASGLKLDLEKGVKTNVLVWGAGTACGKYAVQLLVQAGTPVIAVTSKTSMEQLKAMGALAVLPREDTAATCAAIKRQWPNLHLALDCHSSAETIDACLSTMQQGHLHTLLPNQPSGSVVNDNIKITFDLVHKMFGRPTAILGMLQEPVTQEELAHDYALATRWASFDQGRLYHLLKERKIRPLPARQWPVPPSQSVGLAGIQEALKLAAAGELPSGKVVHMLGDSREGATKPPREGAD